jgi:hypothetical protein
VLLFGIILSLSFANVEFRKNQKQYFLTICCFGMVQTIAYLAFGDEFMFKAYPLLIHFPLFLPLNLIISAYIAKAKDKNIRIEPSISATDFKKYSVPDICSLLFNALENAIYAVDKIDDVKERYIKMKIYSKNNKLCIDLRNKYKIKPVFERGLPVTKEKEHGVGIKSMVRIVEKYNGVYQFIVKEGVFIFQATL